MCTGATTVRPVKPMTRSESLAEAQDALTDRMVTVAGVDPQQPLLDVGYGFGGTAAFLNERLGDISVTGLNIELRQLHSSRSESQRSGMGPLSNPRF